MAVVGGHHRLGVVPVLQQVVLDDPGLVVGDVLELEVRRHVTEREKNAPPRRCPLELVDDNLPARGDFHTRMMGVELIAVGGRVRSPPTARRRAVSTRPDR